MRDSLIRLLGWRATMLHGDPCVTDRWRFASRHLAGGHLRTLDAGAGNGGFAMMAAARGNEVVGLSFDVDEMTDATRRAEVARLPGIRFRIGDLRELDRFSAELGTFDQILCLEVIEHLTDDALLIQRLARLLRPGGRLILSTPTADHRPLLAETVSASENGGHVRWGYTQARIAEIFEAAGLTLIDRGRVSGVVSQTLTNTMRRGEERRARLGWALILPLRPLQAFDRPLTRLLRRPELSITAVGQKQSGTTGNSVTMARLRASSATSPPTAEPIQAGNHSSRPR
jgi:2-polyprenyl-3-methyl-5-hydroxy-6-metoxy-1,4-benzoquinol methylase